MSKAKESLYIETTVPSYATARDSLDVLKLHRQVITRAFWQDERHRFSLCTSRAVLNECAKGDPDAAQRRKEFMGDILVYPVTDAENALAAEYQRLLRVPARAKIDCVHLAVCVTNKIDYLMTWNCTHLGTVAQVAIKGYNDQRGLWVPKLVTPENINETIEMEEQNDLQRNDG
jgi:predicted nucleic acid-binding protein